MDAVRKDKPRAEKPQPHSGAALLALREKILRKHNITPEDWADVPLDLSVNHEKYLYGEDQPEQ